MPYVLCFFLVMGFAPCLWGQKIVAPKVHVGIIDQDRILFDADASKDVRLQMTSFRKQFQDKVKILEKSLRKEEEALEQERDKVSQYVFERKVIHFKSLVSRVQEIVSYYRERLDEIFQKARTLVFDVVMVETKEFAAEKGYTLILPKAVVFYTDHPDVTDDILKRLNLRLPKVSIMDDLKQDLEAFPSFEDLRNDVGKQKND